MLKKLLTIARGRENKARKRKEEAAKKKIVAKIVRLAFYFIYDDDIRNALREICHSDEMSKEELAEMLWAFESCVT